MKLRISSGGTPASTGDEMKDDWHKSYDWAPEKQCFCMTKYGASIRREMAAGMIISHGALVFYRIKDQCQKAEIEQIPVERCGNA